MHMADLFPPGSVLWAIRDCDLHPSHRLHPIPENRLRLFEVLDGSLSAIEQSVVLIVSSYTLHLISSWHISLILRESFGDLLANLLQRLSNSFEIRQLGGHYVNSRATFD